MAVDFIQKAAGNSASTTLSSSVSNTDTSFPLTSDSAFLSGGGFVLIDEGLATEELAYYTGKSGSALTIPLANRGLEGGSAQAHASGASVRGVISADMWNNLCEAILNLVVVTTGALDTTKVVDLTTAQTLTTKTLTSPKIGTSILDTNGNELAKLTATASAVNEVTLANGAIGTGPTVSATGDDTNIDLYLKGKGTGQVKAHDGVGYSALTPIDGWVYANETWTYASASTITVPSGAASKYAVGDRIKWTQTTVKYGVIVAVADTLLTIAINTDYTVANAAISANYYSHAVSPIGYPSSFNYTPTWTADSGVNPAIVNGTISGVFSIVGKDCNVNIRVNMGSSSTYGSGGSAYRLSLPVAYSSSSYPLHSGIYQDSSTPANDCYGYGELAATTYINLRRTGGSYTYTTTPFTWASGDSILFSGTYKI